jgi:hypothetical protein
MLHYQQQFPASASCRQVKIASSPSSKHLASASCQQASAKRTSSRQAPQARVQPASSNKHMLRAQDDGYKFIMKFSFRLIQQNEVQLSIQETVLQYTQKVQNNQFKALPLSSLLLFLDY